jgi:hypothetical protein
MACSRFFPKEKHQPTSLFQKREFKAVWLQKRNYKTQKSKWFSGALGCVLFGLGIGGIFP